MDRNGVIGTYNLRIESQSKRKLKPDEIEILIDGFIEKLSKLTLSAEIEEACQTEIRLLELGYSQDTISKRFFSLYRKAIKKAHDSGRLPNSNAHAIEVTYTKDGELITERQHRAFGLFKYDREFYINQREQSAEKNNAQQDNRRPIVGELIIEKATTYLNDKDPYSQAAAIAVLTGRRVTEVLAKGRFYTSDHPYALLFKGQQKAKGDPVFIIPTLIPAQDILDAFTIFKKKPEIKALRGLDSTEIRGAIGGRVNHRVRTIFGEDNKTGALIPIIEDRKSTSVHSLRGAYAALACVYLKPVQQDDDRFIQAILGHCTGEALKRSSNAPALQHYKHYYVVNRKSKYVGHDDSILKEHGTLPNISPEYLEPETENEPEEPMEQPAAATPTQMTMDQFMEQIAQLAAQKVSGAQTTQRTDTAAEDVQAKIEALEAQNTALQANNEALTAQNDALRTQLELLQTQLSQVGQILNLSSQPITPPATVTAPPPKSEGISTNAKAKEAKTPDQPSPVEARIDILFELFELYCQEHYPIDITQSLIERIGVSRNNVKSWLKSHAGEIQSYRDRFGIEGTRHNRQAHIDTDHFIEWIRHKEQAGKEDDD